MSIESETFSNHLILADRLLDYGFQPEGNSLIYKKTLPEDQFEIIIKYDGTIRGRIMDLAAGDEYVNYRFENASGYSAGIRQKFIDLLMDIREKCSRNQYYNSEQARRICDYIYETYDRIPEFLWPNIPSYAAFRLKGTNKWFAVMGSVPRYKLDPDAEDRGNVEVINVKADSGKIKEILASKGYYPAFHMNKKCWVSIILDDTLSDDEIQSRLKDSFESV